jgi:outer membrane protein TolC
MFDSLHFHSGQITLAEREIHVNRRNLKVICLLVVAWFLFAVPPFSASAQDLPESPRPQSPPSGATSASPDAKILSLTLSEALKLAQKNSVTLQAAVADEDLAREDRVQARGLLLPQVSYNTEYLYTQGNGFGQPRFIANNAVHEYVSQGNVHELIDVAAIANYRRATAAAALAKAKCEIATRGLVVTVVESYFSALASQAKLAAAKKAADEGQQFLELTKQLEQGGEVAHSDVIKAELQAEDRQRQYQEAHLANINARLDLAVLIFPDFNDKFELTDDLHAPIALPTIDEIQQQAAKDNPELRAGLESLRETNEEVKVARAGYLPVLAIDYFYGIDAPNFAVNSVVRNQTFRNLGSSASATLIIPIWNWGATQSRVRQAEIRRSQAKLELSYAQRKLLAEIHSLYSQAETALNELAGLGRSSQLAAESLRLTTMRYRGGEATVLEVVDAQGAFVQASNSYEDGAVRYRVALANLQTLTGVVISQ